MSTLTSTTLTRSKRKRWITHWCASLMQHHATRAQPSGRAGFSARGERCTEDMTDAHVRLVFDLLERGAMGRLRARRYTLRSLDTQPPDREAHRVHPRNCTHTLRQQCTLDGERHIHGCFCRHTGRGAALIAGGSRRELVRAAVRCRGSRGRVMLLPLQLKSAFVGV